MRKQIKIENKKVKISITVNPKINKMMDDEMVNKSKLIDKLLINYYEKKM
jgi:hypothetical protein